MRSDIIRFLKVACKRHGLKANYIPDGDTYVVHLDGRAVQNFNSEQFYQLPKQKRLRDFVPLVKRGLMINLSNKNYEQFLIRKKYEKKIV